ncbi:MATE family efflux transporter [Rufibacter quisquiliarum]|uniref:Multidrug-efflux transporter n=1 Tax=Rufibacter quisquiliarum TaxID=1549639 RepID=A0A839GTW6_9BACT|nr:MATE family efflux transporter [Rufibacter quisquiliarum]MBA9078246.1 putative MATE family efflux protein [Rufibacter quisquiliarum]
MRSQRELLRLIWAAVKGQEQDYTRLSLKGSIVLLATPMILEMLMESLFAVVDIFFVGRLGPAALATVGLTESVLMIVYSVGMGISMAGTAMVARRVGEKKFKQAGSTTFQLLATGTVLALLMGLVTFLFAEEILRLMGATPEIIQTGVGYARIIFAGNLVIILLFLINGAFRGAGQPHLAMRALWISNAANLVLDPLLIFGVGNFTGLGLEGAAWATTTGRSIGVLYQLYHLFNGRHLLKITQENLVLRLKTVAKILKVSAGGMGQFMIESASWIFLTRIVAESGSSALAGYTIAFRVIMFTLLPAWGLSSAAATLVGQNLGAGKPRRAELSVLITARYNMIFLGVVTVAFFLFGKHLAAFFSQEQQVVAIASEGLKIITLGYVFFGLGMVMVQAFNGAGDTRTPTLINILVLWIIEIPLAYLLALHLGYGITGIFATIACSHSLHALISWWLFRKGRWKTLQV